MRKLFKVLSVTCLSLMMGVVMIVPAGADNSNIYNEEETISYNIYVEGDYIKVDEEGEVIEFFIPSNGFSQGNVLMQRSAAKGIYKFITGACFVVEVLSGYSCIDIIRYIGGQFINGVYMNSKGQKYTGTWQVTYGYIAGCQPQHSGVCYGATYTKIG